MYPLVTSFTRESITHTRAQDIASCVLSVVLNKTNKPQDMKLMPYDDVIAFNNKAGVAIKRSRGRFLIVNKEGKTLRQSHPSEVAARLSHWADSTKSEQ